MPKNTVWKRNFGFFLVGIIFSWIKSEIVSCAAARHQLSSYLKDLVLQTAEKCDLSLVYNTSGYKVLRFLFVSKANKEKKAFLVINRSCFHS